MTATKMTDPTIANTLSARLVLVLSTTALGLVIPHGAQAREGGGADGAGAGPAVVQAERLTDLRDARFRPRLPLALHRAGAGSEGVFRICVDRKGQVSQVETITPADPIVNDAWIAVMRRWQYRPYSVGGQPVPFCHVARIKVRPHD